MPAPHTQNALSGPLSRERLHEAWRLMCTADALSELYETHKARTGKYVHATSRGHEAAQLALGMQLLPQDFVSPYYRDDALLLAIGVSPWQLMLQLFAKRDDPFSGGRIYYAHPSLRDEDKPKIIHQSSATGMQAIPATGIAQGVKYREQGSGNREQGTGNNIAVGEALEPPLVVCSIGDGAMTEGEVSEALQMAALHQLPVLYFVQDNGWGISATGKEMYAQSALEFVKGMPGIETASADGSDFVQCYEVIREVLGRIRAERRPFLLHVKVPLLAHHTSGVRREWYRDDIESHRSYDPLPRLFQSLMEAGISAEEAESVRKSAFTQAEADLERAYAAEDPDPASLFDYIYAPAAVTEEQGERQPEGAAEVVMVDAGLHAIDQILAEFPEALVYGQDVGGTLGGVFRETALLAQKYGSRRVFNTPIQEAYIIGSTAGMSAAGCKPIVEIQFADYMWPGLNQLFAELSRSYYLSRGKWPVQALIRVPTGAYGSGGPFHSSSIESAVLNIRGVKVVYPSNAADMKGLMRAAFLDPNPVVMFEHKGLYWSKVPGSKEAKTPEPADDYVIPLGKARIYQEASPEKLRQGDTCVVIAYGMGVHWARNASRHFPGQVEILDLRTLEPLDWQAVAESVARHGKVFCLTEEVLNNSFMQALAGRISSACFTQLDAPVHMLGAETVPAIPLNAALEAAMLPNEEKVRAVLEELLGW